MRRSLVVLHRWCGLFTALFLIVAGLTGAVIAWDHELDAWLNPALHRVAEPSATPLPALSLAERLEAAEPAMRIRYLPLAAEPGQTLLVFGEPRLDPRTHEPLALDFNQVAVNPGTGVVQAKRTWGAFALSRETLLPFLYKLHYSLHLPHVRGMEAGVLFMGIVALVWALDALIALSISFPSVRALRKSFAFRVRQGGYRLLFDLHRSGGVWLWPLLLVLAVSALSMNLGRELVRPIVAQLSPLTPSPYDALDASAALDTPKVARAQALAAAVAEARRRGIEAPAGGIAYSALAGIYEVGFFEPGGEHGDGTLGVPWVYVDARDGRVRGARVPGTGSAGDLFMQAQFPLHSGRLFGVWGRVVVSVLGLLIAGLSATGLVIWARKRRARLHQRLRAQAPDVPHALPLKG